MRLKRDFIAHEKKVSDSPEAGTYSTPECNSIINVQTSIHRILVLIFPQVPYYLNLHVCTSLSGDYCFFLSYLLFCITYLGCIESNIEESRMLFNYHKFHFPRSVSIGINLRFDNVLQ